MNFQILVLLLCTAVVTLADETKKTDDVSDPQPIPDNVTSTVSPTVDPTTTTVKPTTPTTQHTTTTPKPTPTPEPTTTPKPTTTPQPTTPPPTTTPKPTTTSTPAPTTTPAPAPTTPAPKHTDWIVKDLNGTVCIIANMVMKISVPYHTIDNKTVYAEFKIDKIENATATGVCGKDNQTLVLSWENVTATFNFTRKNTTYSMSGIELAIKVNNVTFPNKTLTNVSEILLKHTTKVFSLPMTNSYTCASVSPLALNGSALNHTIDATLTVTKVHVEAFGTEKDAKFKASMDCAGSQTPDIVPIAVGLILAGLVIVVLIAYLVGRRRAQARGYLSM